MNQGAAVNAKKASTEAARESVIGPNKQTSTDMALGEYTISLAGRTLLEQRINYLVSALDNAIVGKLARAEEGHPIKADGEAVIFLIKDLDATTLNLAFQRVKEIYGYTVVENASRYFSQANRDEFHRVLSEIQSRPNSATLHVSQDVLREWFVTPLGVCLGSVDNICESYRENLITAARLPESSQFPSQLKSLLSEVYPNKDIVTGLASLELRFEEARALIRESLDSQGGMIPLVDARALKETIMLATDLIWAHMKDSTDFVRLLKLEKPPTSFLGKFGHSFSLNRRTIQLDRMIKAWKPLIAAVRERCTMFANKLDEIEYRTTKAY